jgi:hypothetical protein
LDTSLRLYRSLTGTSTPLFFLDGDHSYKSVRRELLGVVNEVPAASILLHDTFNQSEESKYNTGPYRAIMEILNEIPGRFDVLSCNTGLPGMTLLYRNIHRKV